MNVQSLFSSKHHNYFKSMLPSKKWLSRLNQVINQYPDTSLLNNEELAKKLEISKRQLFRKIKNLTGLSPQQYLRRYRLYQAMNFLETGQCRTVNETAYKVGYSNVGYFIAQFEKEFGKKPLQVLQEQGWR